MKFDLQTHSTIQVGNGHKEILTSLTWVDSGNPNVSNILFQYYFLDNFLCTRGIEWPLIFLQWKISQYNINTK